MSTPTPSMIGEETFYERVTRERRESKRFNSIGYYDFEKSIGEGNFAKVKLATHVLTGVKVTTLLPLFYPPLMLLQNLAEYVFSLWDSPNLGEMYVLHLRFFGTFGGKFFFNFLIF